MTNTLTVIRFTRSILAASLLGAALLVGSAHAGAAAEATAIQVAAPLSQTQDGTPAAPAPAAGTSAQPAPPARAPGLGAVGFGWG